MQYLGQEKGHDVLPNEKGITHHAYYNMIFVNYCYKHSKPTRNQMQMYKMFILVFCGPFFFILIGK